MPSEHARLSPSGAERWLSCPASIRMAEVAPERDGDGGTYALEGTAAHELAELKTRHTVLSELSDKAYKLRYQAWREKYGYLGAQHDDTLVEMNAHASNYAELLRVKLNTGSNGILLLEQRLATGLPKCWGTSDAVVVSPGRIEVVDYKYGAGVPVSAVNNSQLKLYALGALDTYGVFGDVEVVTLTVVQPRCGDGHVSSWDITADDLRAWREEIRPIAVQALNDPAAPFGPSDTACRWCPAAGVCRARMEASLEAAAFDVPADTLSPNDIADVLPKLKAIRAWCTAVEDEALRMAYRDGTSVPGYKVVLKGGRRYVTDSAALIQTLIDNGYPVEAVATFDAKPFGVLEKMVGGRKTFDAMVGRYVGKSQPRPALVTEDSPGEPVDRTSEASRVFGDA